MAKHISAVITCLLMMMITSCVAVDHSVGDWAGWTLGLNYTSWCADKTFHVGDNLVFKYSTEHTVGEVNFGEYTSCTLENLFSNLAKKGSKRKSKKNKSRRHKSDLDTTIITLETPGTHYFICSEPGHCTAGMKFAINVSAKGESATPTSTNIQPSTNNTQIPPYKKSASARAGLKIVPPFVAVLLALVLL